MIIQKGIIDDAEKRMPAEIRYLVPKRATLMTDEALIIPKAPILPKDIQDAGLIKRTANLDFAGAKPSATELERLMGKNDLVDEFFLQRALVAAKPVMKITLRDPAGRERGWATGFMVSPRLLLTNWHVFSSIQETYNAITEADYVLDIAGNPAPSYRFAVRGDQYYASDPQMDFALVAVESIAQDGKTRLSQFGYHRLIAEPNKIRENENMTLIQHPGGERRQFAVRENELVKILDNYLWYKSDTAPGSSGAPALNDSFQVVALHHSGAAKRNEATGKYVLRDGSEVPSLDGIDESQVVWLANEGIRISVLCSFLNSQLPANNPFVQELLQAMQGGDVISQAIEGHWNEQPYPETKISTTIENLHANYISIPMQLKIPLSPLDAAAAAILQSVKDSEGQRFLIPPQTAEEVFRSPIVDRDYSKRTGYEPGFLGIPVTLPTVTDLTLVSKLADGKHEIPYEHFTIVVNKQRRLALFTASNVDYSLEKTRPEAGDYSRKGLSGLGPNDIEKWLTDPRIPQQDQLPDVFYTKDGGVFDKGHIVRREDMCWGDCRDQIVRANGDTYHVTNCSPQEAGFNQSQKGEDNWGDLENEIRKQAKLEKLSILAGPILADDDQLFEGKDDFSPVKIRIPRVFWKVVLANDNGSLAAFAFILKQDLHNIPEEFSVTATWAPYLVSLADLQARLPDFIFPAEIMAADRSGSDGQELARAVGVNIHPNLRLGKRIGNTLSSELFSER